jgi:hypothetical protein
VRFHENRPRKSNSLLRREIPCSVEKIPCSPRKNSLFRKEQGIHLQRTEIATRIGVESAKIAFFPGNFSKFPVKFPVLREFEGVEADGSAAGQTAWYDSEFWKRRPWTNRAST